jgi:hypothetical protein
LNPAQKEKREAAEFIGDIFRLIGDKIAVSNPPIPLPMALSMLPAIFSGLRGTLLRRDQETGLGLEGEELRKEVFAQIDDYTDNQR